MKQSNPRSLHIRISNDVDRRGVAAKPKVVINFFFYLIKTTICKECSSCEKYYTLSGIGASVHGHKNETF